MTTFVASGIVYVTVYPDISTEIMDPCVAVTVVRSTLRFSTVSVIVKGSPLFSIKAPGFRVILNVSQMSSSFTISSSSSVRSSLSRPSY